MHVHTIYSYHPLWRHDCYSRPEQVIKAALKRGLGGIAIADHDTLRGYIAARQIVKKIDKDFIIVPASEIRSMEGDILGYNISEEIKRKLGPEETIENIVQQGGFAVIAHPFPAPYTKLINKKSWSPERLEGLFKEFGRSKLGFEAFNSTSPAAGNRKALELAEKLGAIKTAGSDSHILPSLGSAGIEVSGSDPVKELLSGKANIWGRQNPKHYPALMYSIKFVNLFKKTRLD